MTAMTRARRSQTAQELGERFNRSPRTVRRVIAEPREDYLTRAQQRRERIRELREQGMTYRAIAAEVGCSLSTVHTALHYQDNESVGESDDEIPGGVSMRGCQ